ncbi:MAG: nucleotidyltransferase family protein, partial [Candidatus Staskawiczbacteria bacterium]|nr:nucleotidyltransferase family protein [Candidatus Staskawiczbacteria bacterium]
VSYPSLEDAVIYSALHFSRHLSYTILCLWSFPGLKNILDIHEILSKKESAINWGYIAKTSKKYKITSIVYSGLYLSKKYFNTRLPIRYLSSVEPNFFKRKILETFLLNKYLQLMDARNKSEIGLFTYSHETNLIYACLFEEDYFKRKLFSYPIKAFAEEHKLPYPSFKTSILSLLRIFLFIKMLLLKNRNSVKP